MLYSAKIQDEDIQALKDAIEADENALEHKEKEFGENVSAWFKSMMVKAGGVAWDMNVGVASSLLATALNSFYGWL